MRSLAFIAALCLAAVAVAGQPGVADLAKEVAELRQQLAELRQGGAAGPKIGFVNIVRVFDELDEKLDMNTELRKLEERRDAEMRDLVNRARDLREQAKALRPESDEFKKNQDQLQEVEAELRSRGRATEDQLYGKLFDFTHDIYKKIREEIEDYAREAGYDLVLRVRDPDIGDFDQALQPRHKYLELNRRIEYRSVLAHRSAHEFTNAIIKRLNEKYRREKSEKERAQPPTPEPKKPDAPEGKE